jgi:hypothetical protein
MARAVGSLPTANPEIRAISTRSWIHRVKAELSTALETWSVSAVEE